MKDPLSTLRRASLASTLLLSLGSLALAQTWPGVESLAPPPSDPPGPHAVFGVDIAISGDWAAVGDHGRSSIYMYRRGSAGWEYVHGVDAPVGSRFGTAIAIDGHTMVAGMRDFGWPDIGPGRVWVFMRTGGQWIHTHELVVPELEDRSRLGYAVDIEGDRIIASAPFHNSGPTQSEGGIVVFERNGAEWEQKAFMEWTPCCPGVPDVEGGGMGMSISLSGDRIAAGAPVSLWGEVYVFTRQAENHWARTAIIVDPAPKQKARFGRDVALQGDQLLIGRPRFGSPDFFYYPGDAYFYEFSSSTGEWELQQVVQASDGHGGPEYGDQFGARVALAGDRAFVAAWRHDGPGPIDGKVYAFERTGPAQLWTEVEHYQSPLHLQEDVFGRSLDVSEEYLLVGVSDAHVSQRKRAYAIERPIGTSYCDGGGDNLLTLIGSASIQDDALSLVASELETGSRSLFLLGEDASMSPFGSGQLCIGPTVYRVSPLRVATDMGKVVESVDFDAPPYGTLATLGTTLYFQHWAQAPGASSQLSNAVSLQLE